MYITITLLVLGFYKILFASYLQPDIKTICLFLVFTKALVFMKDDIQSYISNQTQISNTKVF